MKKNKPAKTFIRVATASTLFLCGAIGAQAQVIPVQSFSFDFDASQIVGSNTAYVGFTAGTGNTATVAIEDWFFDSGSDGSYEIAYPSFSSGTNLTLNGTVTEISSGTISMFAGVKNKDSSAYANTPMDITSFTTYFSVYGLGAADGYAFILQNDPTNGLNALGTVKGNVGIQDAVSAGFGMFTRYADVTINDGGAQSILGGSSDSSYKMDYNNSTGTTYYYEMIYDGTTLNINVYDQPVFTAVPEPSTYAFILGLILCGGLAYRRSVRRRVTTKVV